jgi:hypothetical protein
MKHTLNKTVDTEFHIDMLNTNASKILKERWNMYGHLEIRQLGNVFKYNENYIHKWITHSTQD